MIKKNILFWIGIGLIAVLLLLGVYYFFTSGAEISANGSSVIKAQPDLMSVSITIESRNPNAQTAQDKVSEISTKLLNELSNLGFETKDIELANYNVYPEYDWNNGKQDLKGYVANQQLTIRLKDFERVSAVIDTASSSGALVSGINYELSSAKQNEYKAQALNEASEDARVKATSIASGFGKKLGRLVSVQSQDFNYYPYPLYARADTALGSNAEAQKAVVGVSPSELDVSASVSATFRMMRF